MIEVWGRPYSSNVIPVLWAVSEVGQDYRLKLAGGSFGKLDTPEFRDMNPNRMIPTLRDGDFPLWESRVIVRYLCEKFAPGRLCPDTLEQRAVADQWMEWSGTRAFSPVIQLFFATVRTDPARRDQDVIQAHANEAASVLAILDSHLTDQPYVAGSAFTMADIPIGCVVYRYFNIDVVRPSLPNVEAWYGRLCRREAYQRHVMRPFGKNPDDWQALELASASEGDA